MMTYMKFSYKADLDVEYVNEIPKILGCLTTWFDLKELVNVKIVFNIYLLCVGQMTLSDKVNAKRR